MFVSLSEKTNQAALDIFEALDLDNGESADYLKERCSHVPKEILVKLRDKRFGNEVLFLIRMGHDVEPIDSSCSKITPLMDAIANKYIEIAVVLVEYGSKLSTTDVNGENSLHYAARTGCSRLIKWLVKAANLTKPDIQSIASTSNIKLKFPEDLAADHSLAKEVLTNFREHGAHISQARTKRPSRSAGGMK